MKVIIDTRHDTLEDALAAVRSAFGAAATLELSALDEQPSTRRNGRNGRSGPKRRNTAAMNPTSNIAPKGESDKVRAWARAQGIEVKDSGRMPAAVIRAYQAAHAN